MLNIFKKIFGKTEAIEVYQYKELDEKSLFVLENKMLYKEEISPMYLVSFLKFLEKEDIDFKPNEVQISDFFNEKIHNYSISLFPENFSFTLVCGVRPIHISSKNKSVMIGDFIIRKSGIEDIIYEVYSIEKHIRIVFKVIENINWGENNTKIIIYEAQDTLFYNFLGGSANTLKLDEFEDLSKLSSFLDLIDELNDDDDEFVFNDESDEVIDLNTDDNVLELDTYNNESAEYVLELDTDNAGSVNDVIPSIDDIQNSITGDDESFDTYTDDNNGSVDDNVPNFDVDSDTSY